MLIILKTRYNSCLKSCDNVRDDENAKETLVKVTSHPILPMWYRKNVYFHTFYEVAIEK